MRGPMGVIVALLGAVTAFVATIAFIYALFGSGDALIWVPMMFVFGFLSLPAGAVCAVLLWRHRWPKPR
jgi:hypothetical protein